MNLPNRLAKEGEELVAHRFGTGSMGLASPCDVKNACAPAPKRGWLREAIAFFNVPEPKIVPAVCVPPGAKMRLQGIPPQKQAQWNVGPNEEVQFTQITAAAHAYRDAVRFSNGRVVRLQEFIEGQRITVLDLSGTQESIEFHEEFVVVGR